MQRLSRCLGMLLLSLAFLAPTITAQEKKTDDPKTGDDKKDSKTTKTKSKVKVDWGFTVDAKLTVLDTKDEKEFTVQVQYKVPEPNPGAQQQILQAQQQIAQHQAQIASAKTVQARQQAMQQLVQAQLNLQKAMASATKLKDMTMDFKCQAMTDMRIRHKDPQVGIDDATGEFQVLTKKEKDDLRADGYPGYPAEFKNLAVGQTVRVYFSKDTKTPASLLPKDKKGSAPKANDLQEDMTNFRYDVIQIVVIADVPEKKAK
jgi:hypothetical protein